MRTAWLAGVVLVASVSGCSGSQGGQLSPQLPPDSLDHDAAAAFSGRWYGTVVVSTGGTRQPASTVLDASVTGRNELTFPALCSDGSGPTARVTSDSAFTAGSYRCPLPVDDCTVTWDVQGGSGVLLDGTLALSLSGIASGCGRSGSLAFEFSGTRTLPESVDRGPPVAAVGAARVLAVTGNVVPLDASGSSDPDGRPLTFAWTVTQAPAGASPTLTGGDTAQPVFQSSTIGVYALQVTVTASDGQSATASVAVKLLPGGGPMTALLHGVVHAEHISLGDSIVMTGESPDKLYVYHPPSGTESEVTLPLPPQCLSVSPDGRHALVGHNAWITYVDLTSPDSPSARSIPTQVDAGACTLGNAWAYVFPKDDWNAVHSIELSTGNETGNTTNHYDGSRGVLTPDATTLYADTANQSPMDLKRWDVSHGVATFAYEMAYHGDYPVGDLIWMERSGARVFTSAGTAFHASSVREQDMTYAGALSGLSSVAHLDTSASEIAAIPRGSSWDPTVPSDSTVELFNTEYLAHVDRIDLPGWWVDLPLPAGGALFETHGRFVFYSGDETRKHVIVQADASSGLEHDVAVLTY
jgi:hypothetical protein